MKAIWSNCSPPMMNEQCTPTRIAKTMPHFRNIRCSEVQHVYQISKERRTNDCTGAAGRAEFEAKPFAAAR